MCLNSKSTRINRQGFLPEAITAVEKHPLSRTRRLHFDKVNEVNCRSKATWCMLKRISSTTTKQDFTFAHFNTRLNVHNGA